LDDAWVPRLLIVDYRLPGVRDGIEVIERLRSRLGPVPALLITGDTGPEHLRRAAQSGLPVLHKPVRGDTLRGQLRRLLRLG
jgi:CheY-like chemotaxis protein